VSGSEKRSLAEREKALVEVFTVASQVAEQTVELFKSFEECLGPEWEREGASANISGSLTYPKWWVFDYANSFYYHSPCWEATKVIKHSLFLTVCIDGRTLGGKRIERPVVVAGRLSWHKARDESAYALARPDGLSAWTRTNPPRAMDGQVREAIGFTNDKNKGPEVAMVLGVPLLEIAGPEDLRSRIFQPLASLVAEAVATPGGTGEATLGAVKS